MVKMKGYDTANYVRSSSSDMDNWISSVGYSCIRHCIIACTWFFLLFVRLTLVIYVHIQFFFCNVYIIIIYLTGVICAFPDQRLWHNGRHRRPTALCGSCEGYIWGPGSVRALLGRTRPHRNDCEHHAASYVRPGTSRVHAAMPGLSRSAAVPSAGGVATDAAAKVGVGEGS